VAVLQKTLQIAGFSALWGPLSHNGSHNGTRDRGREAAGSAAVDSSHNPALFVKKGHGTDARSAPSDRSPVMGAPAVHPAFWLEPVAVSKPDAARALGMSVDSFERYVVADVRCIRRGRLRLYPMAELRRWADDNADGLLSRGRGS